MPVQTLQYIGHCPQTSEVLKPVRESRARLRVVGSVSFPPTQKNGADLLCVVLFESEEMRVSEDSKKLCFASSAVLSI